MSWEPSTEVYPPWRLGSSTFPKRYRGPTPILELPKFSAAVERPVASFSTLAARPNIKRIWDTLPGTIFDHVGGKDTAASFGSLRRSSSTMLMQNQAYEDLIRSSEEETPGDNRAVMISSGSALGQLQDLNYSATSEDHMELISPADSAVADPLFSSSVAQNNPVDLPASTISPLFLEKATELCSLQHKTVESPTSARKAMTETSFFLDNSAEPSFLEHKTPEFPVSTGETLSEPHSVLSQLEQSTEQAKFTVAKEKGHGQQVITSPPKGSVKHLTCYYWRTHGRCTKSDNDCLYAHHNTGLFADEPKKLEPGRPAVAGRNARSTNPVFQSWRKVPGTDAGIPYQRGTRTPQRPSMSHNMSYGSPEPPQLYHNPFDSSRRNSSVGSPPHSELAEQFKKNLQLSHLSNLSTSATVPDEKLVKELKDSVSLQGWGLKKSEAILRDVNEQVSQCIKSLEIVDVNKRSDHDGIQDLLLNTLRALRHIDVQIRETEHDLKVLKLTVKNNLRKESLADSSVASEGQGSENEDPNILFINHSMSLEKKVTDYHH